MSPTFYTPLLLSAILFTAKNANALTLNRRQADHGPWVEQGCYTDISSGRTLIAASFADPTMTVESCLAFCTNAGTHYAGVENGNECWCDFAIQNPGVPAEATECNIPCAGDPLEICGAGGRLSMYYDGTPDPVAVPAIDTWAYQGCFKDSAAARLLLERLDGPGLITPQQCTTSCKAAGYTFAGFEFAFECWCGHEMTEPVLVDDSDCKMACAGDRTAFCGGSNRITVYKDIPADPEPTTTEPAPTTTEPTDPEPTTTDPAPTTTADPEPTTTAEPEPTTTAEPEPTTTAEPEPTTTAEPEPTTTAEPEPTTTAEPEPTTTAEPEPTTTAEPEPTTTAEPEPTTTAEPEPTTTAEPEPTTTAEPEPTTTEVEDPLPTDE